MVSDILALSFLASAGFRSMLCEHLVSMISHFVELFDCNLVRFFPRKRQQITSSLLEFSDLRSEIVVLTFFLGAHLADCGVHMLAGRINSVIHIPAIRRKHEPVF